MKYKNYNLEDLLSDADFFQIARSRFKNEDLDAWNNLLLSYPEKREIIEEAYNIINSIKIKTIPVSESQIQKNYISLEKKIKQRRNQKVIYRISSVAACMLVIISGYFFYMSSPSDLPEKEELLSRLSESEITSDNIEIIVGENKNTVTEKNAVIKEGKDGSIIVNNDKKIETTEKTNDYIQLIVPRGKRSYIELKDGSKIWINSGSKLLYPSRFDAKRRDIYIDGEAYLEVARNEESPFYVHTNKLDVRVLGTSFNICSYPDDSFTEVVLVNGSVEVDTKQKKPVKLTPDMCLRLEEGITDINKVEVYNYTCWKEGIMKLNDEELKNIFKRLSRYYNIDIIVPPEIGNIHYKGKIALEDTLEKIIENISQVEPISYTKEENIIRLFSNN